MHSLFDTPTLVDPSADDTVWLLARSVRITLEPVTEAFRRDHPHTLHRGARWAVVDHDTDGRDWVLGDNLDVVMGRVNGIVGWAAAVAAARGADFVWPDQVCIYCCCPVPAGHRFCPDTDCHLLHGGNETTWRS